MRNPIRRRSRRVSVVLGLVLVAAGAAWVGGSPVARGAAAPDGATSRVSVGSTETQSDGRSFDPPAISQDGRFVVFTNDGSNLVDGDTNGSFDVFVRNTVTGTTRRVSVSSNETQAEGHEGEPIGTGSLTISADGRYVAFMSDASNLVPGDTNGRSDVFVRDRATGTTRRVSVSSSERQANTGAGGASISANGRYVAFGSRASNVVPGDTNQRADVFVRDRSTGTTRRVSMTSNQSQADDDSYTPVLSADGQRVAFLSVASNLVAGDTNGWPDVFVRYRPTGTTYRVSVSSTEVQSIGNQAGSLAISADGAYVAFFSTASNLVSGDTDHGDVFVRDRKAGTTERVSVANNGAQSNSGGDDASISADGQRVTFASSADNLVSGDTNGWIDVFIRDQVAGTTSRVSVSSDQTQGDGNSYQGAISGDGDHVAFVSEATDLVLGDTNSLFDTFVRDFAP